MFELSRRDFLKSVGVLSVGAALPGLAFAAAERPKSVNYRKLTAGYRNIEVNGKSAKVFGLLDENGNSGLVFNQGDMFNVTLQNHLKEPTLIHWHGLTPPWKQDGVPGVTQDMLQPGGSYDYSFKLERAGTNWMHAHTLQEQNLLAAPLIIRDVEKPSDQEVVILLHDFSFKSPEELLAGLQKGVTGHVMHNMSGHDMANMPPEQHAEMMKNMQAQMSDMNDIEYDAYLANDRTLADPEVVSVEKSGRVRLRIINGATSTNFTVDLGVLSGELIAVDGIDIIPVKGSSFPISMAQRLDILIQLQKESRAWPVLMKREGALEQTGIILASKGAVINKIPTRAEQKGPVLDLSFEQTLRAANPLSEKPADLEFAYDLLGTMSPYEWRMALTQPSGGKLMVKKGDRVKIMLHNHSMMAHPIHMHGHHFQVVTINGNQFKGAVRDTVLIPPHKTVTIMFDADNVGKKWAFHCHHLYHMVTGMMTFVEYHGA